MASHTTDPDELSRRYRAAHWGNDPDHVFQVDVPAGFPKGLIQMGALEEIALGDETGTTTIEFSKGCHLAFSPAKDQRIYAVLTRDFVRELRRSLVHPRAPFMPLAQAAGLAPGRQNRYSYANVDVQVLGIGEHVVYLTDKKGDGLSSYIHRMGEESGKKPLVCIDQEGHLWFAGGNYSVPNAGITD